MKAPNTAQILLTATKEAYKLLCNPESLVLRESPYRSGGWSHKEILGHLIDSAFNNQIRFIRACLKEDLIFETYEQEKWVALQAYADRNWHDLVETWYHTNIHLSGLLSSIPAETMQVPREYHNLDQTAFKPCRPDHAISLEYFVWDYIAHLENHICQIEPDYQPLVYKQMNY